MRNIVTIGILILLAVGVYFVLQIKPPDPLALNPENVSIPSSLTNPNGNVLWIDLEGVRPDHIGAYGYNNSTTPSIDSLASESMLFERCYAQSSETFRTIATMFTSQYPELYPGGSKESVGMGFRNLLNNQESSLVNQIQASGHTTCAVVSNRLLNKEFGFGKGFDYYDDNLITNPDGTMRIRDTQETYQVTESWLSRNFRRPFFMFVHFPDPSGPYNADPKFADQLFSMGIYSKPDVIPYSPTDNHPFNEIPAFHNIQGTPPTVGEMIKQYDAEIAEVDYYVGKILDSIDRLGINENTMVIISSAHGEALGEHSYYFNSGGNNYNCLTHIPLIVHMPSGDAARIKDVTEGIDIMPTAMSFLGVTVPNTIAGMNLMRFAVDPSSRNEYPAFTYWDSPNVAAVIKGPYELVSIENKEFRMYHVINDPEEIYNLYSKDDPVAQKLRQFLEMWIKTNHQRALDSMLKQNNEPSGEKRPMAIPFDTNKAPK